MGKLTIDLKEKLAVYNAGYGYIVKGNELKSSSTPFWENVRHESVQSIPYEPLLGKAERFIRFNEKVYSTEMLKYY